MVKSTDQAATQGGTWRMFHLSGTSSPGGASDGVGGLFLPPVLVQPVSGANVEEVLLLRDEAADMAWAVERTVSGPTGDPRNREDEWQWRAPAANPDIDHALAPLAYKLATSVPEHWIPLLPVHDGTQSVRLQRGAMLRFGSGAPQRILPREDLLEPNKDLLLFEEEVPRAGSHLSRVPVLARWLGGNYLTWTARRKNVGTGEGSSGLRYDLAQ